jgi:hypothetical protein
VAGSCSMPILSLIDNKLCIQIYARVNTCEYGQRKNRYGEMDVDRNLIFGCRLMDFDFE